MKVCHPQPWDTVGHNSLLQHLRCCFAERGMGSAPVHDLLLAVLAAKDGVSPAAPPSAAPTPSIMDGCGARQRTARAARTPDTPSSPLRHSAAG